MGVRNNYKKARRGLLMINLASFKIIEEISMIGNIGIYRATRKSDNKVVVLKLLNDKQPNLQDIAKLKQEYQLLKKFDDPNIIKAYSLVEENDFYAIELENFDNSNTLKSIITSHKLDIKSSLNIAIKLAHLLALLHKERVIHKDISPYNILLSDSDMKLIDFSIACQLSQQEESKESDTLEGTLSYMSPEQTGRVNRSIDYRTDFYSFGMVLYEMISGRLPFQADDAPGWVYAHIAKKPTPPHKINPNIPEPLSQIIMKLLSKSPDERYQTEACLISDLKNCLDAWTSMQKIPDFPIAQHDVSGTLQIKEKLYGRENEIDRLRKIINKTADGEQNLVLITGFSGIGKTSLINEIKKYIYEKKTFFTSGKFEQFQRDIPYSSKALRPLIKQILSKPSAERKIWKEKINAALHPNAQIIIDVIPEMGLLLGEQPPVPELPHKEAKARFEMIFLDFANVFSKEQYMLAICIDDLQWADSATIDLIKNLLLRKSLKQFLIIGAYRENEVKPGHLLLEAIEDLKKAEVSLHEISLSPLSLENINQLVTDSLPTQWDTKNLSELILDKTGGNPFFINSLLNHLYESKNLTYDEQKHQWTWDIEQIKQMSISDNVVELLIDKINSLEKETIKVLQIASCIGDSFDLKTLSRVYGKPPKDVANKLWPALEEKLIMPHGQNYHYAMIDENFANSDNELIYRFAHDRIQQAAYSQLPDEEKEKLSLQIGRMQLKGIDSNQITLEKLFNILNYFIISQKLVTDKEEKKLLAKLFFKGGTRAKASIAYNASEKYLKCALGYLGKNAWEEHYELALKTEMELAETIFSLGRYQETEAHYNKLIKQAKTNLDKAKVRLSQLTFLIIQTKIDESYEACLNGLRFLGIDLSEKKITPFKLLCKFIKLKWLMRNKREKILINTKAKNMPIEENLIIEYTVISTPILYLRKPILYFYLALISLEIALEYGVNSKTSSVLAIYALLHAIILKNYKRTDEIMKDAFSLMDKYKDPAAATLTYTFAIVTASQLIPFKEYINYAYHIYQIGKEYGEKTLSSYAICSILNIMFMQGSRIDDIADKLNEFEKSIPDFIKNVMHDITLFMKMYDVIIKTLKNKELNGDLKSWSKNLISETVPHSSLPTLVLCCITTLTITYIVRDWDSTFALIEKIKKHEKLIPFSGTFGEYYFIYSLALVSIYNKSSWFKKLSIHHTLKSNIKELRIRSLRCPENYEAKYLIVLAAYELIRGNQTKAIKYYEDAVSSAKNNELTYIEAICHEFVGDYLFDSKQFTSASGFINKAIYIYNKWGAVEKAAKLMSQYDKILSEKIVLAGKSPTVTTQTDSIKLLDLVSIMKSAQAISGNINVKDLLVNLIKSMLELSGAERSILLLVRKGQLFVEGSSKSIDKKPTILQHIPLENFNDISKQIVRYVEMTKQSIYIEDAHINEEYKYHPYIKDNNVLSILCIPIMHQRNVIGVLYLENNLMPAAFKEKQVQILQLLASQAAISLEISQLYEAYDKFVPHQFLELLDKRSIIDVSLGDHVQKNMTILFSDIRNFTHLSEQISSGDLFDFMIEYLSYMEEIINKHGGFIDKFIGDAIMALFPGPVEDALNTSIAMQKELNKINVKNLERNKPGIRIGIGINSGNLMLCTLGGAHRIETSVLGDAVNIASRLEGLTKKYGSSILLSDAAFRQLQSPDEYKSRFAGYIKIVGKEKEIGVWEVYDGDNEKRMCQKIAISKWYNEAISVFYKKEHEQALDLFKRCLDNLPNDKLIKRYIIKCEQHLSNPSKPGHDELSDDTSEEKDTNVL